MKALWKCGEGGLIKGHKFWGEIRKTLGEIFQKLFQKMESDSIQVEILFFLYYKQIYSQYCYPIQLLIGLSNIVITKWSLHGQRQCISGFCHHPVPFCEFPKNNSRKHFYICHLAFSFLKICKKNKINWIGTCYSAAVLCALQQIR